MWDFPRFSIVVICFVLLVLNVWFLPPGNLAIVPLLAAAIAFQLWNIFPYTPLARIEAQRASVTGDELDRHGFTILSVNVLQQNRAYDRVSALIEELQPDIVLLMETDHRWAVNMKPVIERFTHSIELPIHNEYGKIFATNLPIETAHVLNLADPRTPSIHLIMRTRGGQRFRLGAIHPRPPLPGDDTDARDAELVAAAKLIREANLPAIVVGDFNDVGWSHTSRLARRVGGYVDPRIGRGFFGTFPSYWPAFRWPLDHIFFTKEFALVELRVERKIGSDHLPVFSELVVNAELGETLNNTDDADNADLEAAQVAIDNYREDELHQPGDTP